MAVGAPALPFTLVAHAFAVVAAVLVLVWCLVFRGGFAWSSANKNLIFNLHPFLMLIGLVIIGGQAAISYRSLPFPKDRKKLIHMILHGIALILGIIGIVAVFKYHNESNISNLYSLHSWLGIAVISFYGMQWVFGLYTFFYPGGSPELRRVSLPWHVVLGLMVYFLAVTNSLLGFLEKLTFLENSGLAKYGAEAILVNVTAVVTVLYGAFVALSISGQTPAVPEDDFGYAPI